MQDVKILKRRRWHYLILDEAHMIKNWKSQRWQALLNFSARHRLLITGAPPPPHTGDDAWPCVVAAVSGSLARPHESIRLRGRHPQNYGP